MQQAVLEKSTPIDTPSDLLRIDYTDQHSFKRQRLRDKFRVQVPLILLVTVVAQWSVAVFGYGITGLPSILTNSVLTVVLVTVASLFNYRRLRLFPGSRRLTFLVPSFALPWAVAVAVLLWMRPDYSIVFLGVGAVVSFAASWLASAMTRRANSAPLYVIPSMRTKAMIAELPGLDHRICEDPSEITDTNMPIVADLHGSFSEGWERALAQAAMNGSTIYHIKQVSESLTGRVRIDHLSENSFGTLRPNTLYFQIKGLLDRAVAAVLLVPALPVLALAALAIKIDSPGPVIFRQKRIGFRAHPFTVFKLRTMRSDPPGKDEREAAITLVNDPRITRIGKFLRDTRIDELPQLINVVRGELSLIGPRPEAEPLSRWYDRQIEFYAYRHVVKPGITGWAQVNQGHVASDAAVHRKLQYDFYYIKHFSLWLDTLIALKTIWVMFFRKGAK